ncbi:31611_t:CDS:2, partial [Racocetra persica]
DPRWKIRFGLDLKLEDSLAACLVDQYPTRTPIDITAENLSKKITLLVNKLITDAAGCFSDEITPVEVKTKKDLALFSRNEYPFSEDAVKEHEIVSLARIVSYSVTGIESIIMGIGPVLAIKEALKRANLKLSDIGLVEVNKAFAS